MTDRDRRAAVLADLGRRFGARPDPYDHDGQTVLLPREQLLRALTALRDEPATACKLLLDVVGVDYLSYPGHRDERFAVLYRLKNHETGLRVTLKVPVDEEDPHLPTAAGLFKIADWMEREVYDQIGIVFDGHPNLKRLLNHHEFLGHPLRKDYPVQRRQHCSLNDPMIDELCQVLERQGYTILDRGEASVESVVSTEGDIR